MSSFRNTAAGIGFSLLTGCVDACSSAENKPEMETVRETISAEDPGSEEGRTKLIVDQMEEQVEGQVGGRIAEILEEARKATLAAQTDPMAREYFGDSCSDSFHNVAEGAYAEPIPNKTAGYSIQELTAATISSELPMASTVWGEYQDNQWIGGFSVVSYCLPSGAEKLAGKDAIKAIGQELAKTGFQKEIDLSPALNDELIVQNTSTMEKRDLDDGSTVGYNMDSRVTVFMKK